MISRLDPAEFEARFLTWVTGLGKVTQGVVAVDGKTARHSFDGDRGPILRAWAVEAWMVPGQVKTEEKSNEITVIPELLRVLDLQGCIVTTDAMRCQTAAASKRGVKARRKRAGWDHDYLLKVLEI